MKTSIYSDDFLAGLPREIPLAGKSLCDAFEIYLQTLNGQFERHYEEIAEAYFLLKTFSKQRELPFDVFPTLTGSKKEDVQAIIKSFTEAKEFFDNSSTAYKLSVLEKASEQRFASFFGEGFYYTFSEDNLKTIKDSLKKCQDIIVEIGDIKPSYQHRLIDRIEQLKKSLTYKVTNIDAFWGLLADIKVLAKKYKESFGPVLAEFQVLENIFWKVVVDTETHNDPV
jgi:hypothetical protein